MKGVGVKSYALPPFDEREILRYAGCKSLDGELAALFRQCLTECKPLLSYKVCFRVLSLAEFVERVRGAKESKSLQARLQGRDSVLLFAATVGIGIDRLLERYGKISPTKALFFQAIGAERIERLCEVFCQEIEEKYGNTTARFSAGYGDFPLEAQRDIFSLLDPPRQIGLTLNDSLLMTPTKSVTAVVGFCKE